MVLTFNIIRYGSVYLKRDFNNNYIYNLSKQAVQQQGKLCISGDGEEQREYICSGCKQNFHNFSTYSKAMGYKK